jgi:hypothetical protein
VPTRATSEAATRGWRSTPPSPQARYPVSWWCSQDARSRGWGRLPPHVRGTRPTTRGTSPKTHVSHKGERSHAQASPLRVTWGWRAWHMPSDAHTSQWHLAGVVLQIEQVPHVLGSVQALEAEMWVGDVTHGLVAPANYKLGRVQVACQQCQRGCAHTMKWELCAPSSRRHHPPRCRWWIPSTVPWGRGYLHQDLTCIQVVGLKGTAVVAGDWPIVAKLNESAQEHSWEPRAVSAHGPEEAILAECTVGVVIHVYVKNSHKNITNAKVVHSGNLIQKTVIKRTAVLKKRKWDFSNQTLSQRWTPEIWQLSQLSTHYSYGSVHLTFECCGILTIDVNAKFCFWIEQQLNGS